MNNKKEEIIWLFENGYTRSDVYNYTKKKNFGLGKDKVFAIIDSYFGDKKCFPLSQKINSDIYKLYTDGFSITEIIETLSVHGCTRIQNSIMSSIKKDIGDIGFFEIKKLREAGVSIKALYKNFGVPYRISQKFSPKKQQEDTEKQEINPFFLRRGRTSSTLFSFISL